MGKIKRSRAKAVQRDEQALYQGVLDSLREGVYLTDTQRLITYWNKGAETITGYTPREAIHHHCRDEMLEHMDKEGYRLCNGGCPLDVAMAENRMVEVEAYLIHKQGHRVPIHIRATPVTDQQGTVVGACEVFGDISSRITQAKRLRELEQMAMLDHLTGLANRRYLEVTLLSRLQELQRYGWRFGIIFIDVDNLKSVNDTFGHAAGDLIIRAVGRIIADNARLSDVVGRWGGDEFMAVVPSLEADQLAVVAEKFRTLAEAEVVEDGGRTLSATISVGATPAAPQDTIDTLVSRGDQLMFVSKRLGKNRVTGPGGKGPPSPDAEEGWSDIPV